ncbi:MAG TPA: flippase-like domain-containing protein [Candidatus Cloacimonetes bacterium]|nr:flippase-like domain-containing protein [Candidatus Cloacimonadota bacterium]
MSRKKTISLILGLILGIVLITLWVRATPWAEFKEHFNNLSIKYVILGSAVYISAYFVRAYRWKRIMDIRFEVPTIRVWNYAMAGNLINYLIPIRAGELIKALFVKRNHEVGISDSLPLIIVDKTFDTLAILVVLAMLPFLRLQLSGGIILLMVILGLFFIFSVGIILCAAWKKELVSAFLGGILSIFPKRLKDKMMEFLERFVAGLNIFEHSGYTLVLAVLLTLLGIFLDGLYFYLMFLSFGIGMSFLIVLFGYSLINLSYGLPQPPAQLGSNEWMMIVIFSLGFSLTKSAASAVMAFAHVLTAIIMLVLGSIGIAVSGREIIYMVLKGDK